MPVRMELSRVVVHEVNDQQALYLREAAGHRRFPILVGRYEASRINQRLLEDPPFRPLTYDLLREVILALKGEPLDVVVTEIREHTYYAIIRIRQGDEVLEIDSRPSDAIALAMHCDPPLPIYVNDEVLDEVS